MYCSQRDTVFHTILSSEMCRTSQTSESERLRASQDLNQLVSPDRAARLDSSRSHGESKLVGASRGAVETAGAAGTDCKGAGLRTGIWRSGSSVLGAAELATDEGVETDD
jgi:hypothetical protein